MRHFSLRYRWRDIKDQSPLNRNKCSLSGCESLGFLVASHIKPWKVSDNKERLDKFNGLLLLANLDKAFDLGFISFEENGQIILFSRIEKPEVLGVHNKMHVELEDGQQEYMAYHREKVFESRLG